MGPLTHTPSFWRVRMSQGVIIYDTNNWIRVKLSTDGDSLTINNFWSEVVYKSQMGYLQIFVSDGMDSRRIRRGIYPEYKAKRKPADQSIYDGINLFKNFLLHAPATVLRCELPYTEADDVIASLIHHRSELGFSNLPIDIISTDKDLTQLHNEAQNIRVLAKLPTDVTPDEVHLYKTLVGDNSDNIPGVPGLGPSAFFKIPVEVRKGIERALEHETNFDPATENYLNEILTPKLKENFFECYYDGTMQMFWTITGFLDVPIEALTFKAGDGNLQYVTQEMNDLFIL